MNVRRVLVLVALATCLVALHGVRASETPADIALGANFYGQLMIPDQYLLHPASNDPLNNVQPGTVIFSNGEHTIRVGVQRDGSFVAHRLPFGSYTVHCDYHDFVFPSLRVDLQYREPDHIPVAQCYNIELSPAHQLDGAGTDEEDPLLIPIGGVHHYYIPRQQFDIMGLLKSPMILMMIVSFGLLGIMKLMPEEDIKESQRMTREWQKKLVNKGLGVETKTDKPAAVKSK